MTPDQFKSAAVKIYGRKKWKPSLARDLGCNVATIYRMMHREQVPGPYEVALRGLLEHRKQEIALERAARKLDPSEATAKQQAYEDVFWALLNSSEFIFQH